MQVLFFVVGSCRRELTVSVLTETPKLQTAKSGLQEKAKVNVPQTAVDDWQFIICPPPSPLGAQPRCQA